MAPASSAAPVRLGRLLGLACTATGAAAAGPAADRGGFCCWAADDLLDTCGTCLPSAVAPPASFCSKSQAACSSCGAVQWCEGKEKKNKEISAGTELLLSFNGSQAPRDGSGLKVEIGGKIYSATVVASEFDAFQTPSPTPRADDDRSEVPVPETILDPQMEAVRQHGRLRVQGNKIVGEHGHPVRLRGVSLFWSQWMGQFWNAKTVEWLKRDWHVTLIRAAMGVEKGGYLENPAREKARLEAVVDACIEAGIYVVIDWHDYHAEMHLDEAKAFFRDMAKKYGSTPNVLFETYNEPQQISWSQQIKPYHEELVKVIREYTNNIIILGTRMWSQDADMAAQDPVEGENLAYTIHFYAASMGKELRARVSDALRAGVAVFATEWGVCEYTGSGATDLRSAQAWLDFLEENYISDANWAISDKDESCSALREGASDSGGWPASDLTASGAFIRDSIRSSMRPSASSADVPADELVEVLMKKSAVPSALRRSRGAAGSPAAALLLLLVAAVALGALALVAARWLRPAPRRGRFLALDREPTSPAADQ